MTTAPGNPGNPGSQIGPYTITREIGRGGMGVVYLARDMRLDRDVAIKALPPELAEDADRLARFEREAKTLAQLNHTNIAGIHGIEEQDGQKYLILEYVEGETLAERLDRGALPVDDAIEVAIEIASGVEAAHEAGVIHRDLKPDNVKITPEGKVKVLDFGLARTEESTSTSTGDLRNSPTLTSPVQHSPTIPGAILGTAAYMSPEQARGRKIDKRTDIWSFGVVLYEMLTGASPFVGETASDSIGAVLYKAIDLDRLPVGTPAGVRRALVRCVERDRNLRYRDIGDVRVELLRPEDEAPLSRAPRPLPYVAAAIAVTAIVTWLVAAGLDDDAPTVDPPVVNLSIELEELWVVDAWSRPQITRDGRRVVFSPWTGTDTQLLVRDLDAAEVRVIADTDGANQHCISPDGRWIVFDEDDALRRIPADGGPATMICESPRTRGTTWLDDDTIVFAPDNFGPLRRVDVSGGQPEPLYEMADPSTTSDRNPSALPDGRGVLFVRSTDDQTAWEATSIWVWPPDGSPPKQLVRNAAHGQYLSTGHLIFQRQGTLMAAGFDLETLTVTTSETPVLNGVTWDIASGPPSFDVSATGTLVYLEGSNETKGRVDFVNLNGQITTLTQREAAYETLDFNEDGRRLVSTIKGGYGEPNDLVMLELERDLLRTLAPIKRPGRNRPLWSPDGRWIVYEDDTDDRRGVYRMRADGRGSPEPMITPGEDERIMPWDWRSNGQFLIAAIEHESGGTDIVEFALGPDGSPTADEPRVLLSLPDITAFGSLSPDERWLLFATPSPDMPDLFVVDLQGNDSLVQVSVGGGTRGLWDPAGDRIFYVNHLGVRKTIDVVEYTIDEDGRFRPAPPKTFLDVPGVWRIKGIDIAPDGKGFAVVRDASATDQTLRVRPRVIVNWAHSIRDRLPDADG